MDMLMLLVSRYQAMDVAAIAEISHRSNTLQNVDVTPLVTLLAPSGRVAVTSSGFVEVIGGDGSSDFEIRVAEQVANTATTFEALKGSISDEQVLAALTACVC